MREYIALPLAAAMILLFPTTSRACSACGCSLSADWINQGLDAQPGLKFDLRYDLIPQTQLRSSTGHVDRSTIDLPAEREIEQRTHNSFATLGIDYAPTTAWAFNAQIPWIIRPHTTIAEGDTDASRSRTAGLGDIRLTARYQGFETIGVTGILLGIKLPTGAFNTRFSTGPQAGALLDRGLQAGTGGTDLLLGGYHFGPLGNRLDYFVEVNGRVPVTSRRAFKNGAEIQATAGIHLNGFGPAIPQLQVSVRHVARESGAESDRENSGGTTVAVSGGGAVRLGSAWSIYALAAIPVHQAVHGFQLAPAWSLAVGLRYRM